MNAARFKYKEITDIILRSFKAENQNSKDLHMIIKEKISVMISVDRRLSSYELFIQVYGNAEKNKLNLALVFKKRRLYGYDSEGGKYHCHPFEHPEGHIFVDDRKSIQEFVQESMRFLESKELL